MTNSKIYDIITNKIIAELEKGNVPWKKGWRNAELPMNLVSGKTYRGINVIILSMLPFSSPYFLTFNQVKKLGGNVKRGSKGFPIVFWNFVEKTVKNRAGEETVKTIPFLKYFTVFNLEQIDGIEAPETSTDTPFNTIERAEEIVNNYKTCPEISHGGNRAYYSMTSDKIQLPNQEQFNSEEEYYSTTFHELIHSTGHESRLNRKEVTGVNSFGSVDYSKEELTAELGAAFLSAEAKLDTDIQNSAGYISGWLKALKNDRTLIVSAAAKAQKASDYILQ